MKQRDETRQDAACSVSDDQGFAFNQEDKETHRESCRETL